MPNVKSKWFNASKNLLVGLNLHNLSLGGKIEMEVALVPGCSEVLLCLWEELVLQVLKRGQNLQMAPPLGVCQSETDENRTGERRRSCTPQQPRSLACSPHPVPSWRIYHPSTTLSPSPRCREQRENPTPPTKLGLFLQGRRR